MNKIQQDTYNDFVSNLIPIIIEQSNPLIYKYENDDGKKYEVELKNGLLGMFTKKFGFKLT